MKQSISGFEEGEIIARLRRGGYRLLDTQFQTAHLSQFGTREVPRKAYRVLLEQAIRADGDWWAWPPGRPVTGSEALAELPAG